MTTINIKDLELEVKTVYAKQFGTQNVTSGWGKILKDVANTKNVKWISKTINDEELDVTFHINNDDLQAGDIIELCATTGISNKYAKEIRVKYVVTKNLELRILEKNERVATAQNNERK